MSVFADKSVLITGGTGTFGRAMAKHLLTTDARKIVILSRDELKQSEMMREHNGNDGRTRFFLGDVRDKDRLMRAFEGIDIVIHAAALKQIDAATYNPAEAVKTNVQGTMNVIDAAIDRGVWRVMALSSDKACEATTLYGKTKAVMEGLITAAGVYAPPGRTKFACTRYGNVFGSRGSVLHAFRELAKSYDVLPITDLNATRFHMRIEQAVTFVVLALTEMLGGEIFVPKLPSYRVIDLVAAFDRKWAVTGLRPDEKVHEVMVGHNESRHARDAGDYYEIDRDRNDPVGQWCYASGHNSHFLSVDELRQEIACIP